MLRETSDESTRRRSTSSAARAVSIPGNNRIIAISVTRRVAALMLTSARAPRRGDKYDFISFPQSRPPEIRSTPAPAGRDHRGHHEDDRPAAALGPRLLCRRAAQEARLGAGVRETRHGAGPPPPGQKIPPPKTNPPPSPPHRTARPAPPSPRPAS